METHSEYQLQGESSESIQHVTCECDNFIDVGLNRYPVKVWVDHCHIHGVGTEYFRAMNLKPYGYQYESNTTVAEWLAYLVEREEQNQIEYESKHYYDEEIEY